MYIDMTESEFTDFIDDHGTGYVVRYLLNEGLTLKAEPRVEPGVYRRLRGMDLIEWDGRRWEGFNPAMRDEKIDWAMGYGVCDWVMVLTHLYHPVEDGVIITFDGDGNLV